MAFWNRADKHQQIVEPPHKRISTPAGQRLSTVIQNGDKRASIRKSGFNVTLGDAPRESSEQERSTSSRGGYKYSVWSDGEKLALFRNDKQASGKWRWKRILFAIAVIICAIIALAVGLAVGLKKKGSSNSLQSQSQSQEVSGQTNPTATTTPEAGTLPLPTSTPSGFPVGSYSMVTFLDTVQTNCTANPATWTCHPDTIFNTDPVAAAATFNWIITSPSPGKYEITSTDNPFGMNFKNRELELLDQGKDTEHYRFQLNTNKKTTPSQPISKEDEDAEVECAFAGTWLSADLYTRKARSYPDATNTPEEEPKFPVWPYAVRVEQSAAGGENVPSCKEVSNGKPITEGLGATDPSGSCSCLYKNWRTPSPY